MPSRQPVIGPMPLSPRFNLLLALVVATLSLALALALGSSGSGALLDWLQGTGDPLSHDIIQNVRLPRALAAFGTGASLAVAGVLMQVLLRNPLAEPYILGTSGGAAVGALSVMIGGGAGWLVDSAAFGGAMASTLLVFLLSGSDSGWQGQRLLLTGVVVAAGWGAVVSLLLAVSPDTGLFWLMGDFSFATGATGSLVTATIGVLGGLFMARNLDALATGDHQAALLGVAVQPTRWLVYALGALLTAQAVTTAGVVGFVGLIVPHGVRLLAGSRHRVVVPCAALLGGALLVSADTLARCLLAPRQLPVGAVTAALGVPVFLLLLRQYGRSNLRP
jgi:iron complex transport system permease protein